MYVGGAQFWIPPLLGEISAPPRENIFAGLRTGTPLSSNPVIQLTDSASTADVMCLPFVRSRRMYDPLRSACATSLRGCPLIGASNSTGTSFASKSHASFFDDWKYQTSLPVSGLSAIRQL